MDHEAYNWLIYGTFPILWDHFIQSNKLKKKTEIYGSVFGRFFWFFKMSTLILVIPPLFLVIPILILATPTLERNYINCWHCIMSDEYQQHLLSRWKHMRMFPLIAPPPHTHTHTAPKPHYYCVPYMDKCLTFHYLKTTKPLYSKLCLNPNYVWIIVGWSGTNVYFFVDQISKMAATTGHI